LQERRIESPTEGLADATRRLEAVLDNASVAIFLSTLPLALFAGEALREFALVLLFGVVLATSSSIFIAAPILLYLGENRLRRGPAEEAPAPGIGGPVPAIHANRQRED